MTSRRVGALIRAVLLVFLGFATATAAGAQSIITYHYDNYRTGWNSNETILTPANVNSSNFGLVHSVELDDQVDGQPLYVPGVNITAGPYQGTHNVVYVAAESNTIYAIDAESGTVLLSPNFGTPIPKPLGCNNNGPNVGINSTPVIDPTSNTLYVMVYALENNTPAYLLHALALGSLTDTVSSTALRLISTRPISGSDPACCWRMVMFTPASAASAITTQTSLVDGFWGGRRRR
jgi:hypothetical protein